MHTCQLSPHISWFSGFWDHFPISGSYLKNKPILLLLKSPPDNFFFIAKIENKAIFFFACLQFFKVKVCHTSTWNSQISGHFRYFPLAVSGHYQR